MAIQSGMQTLNTKSLRNRFERFFRTLDEFESIDELIRSHDCPGLKRADYLLANRTLIIEKKVLEVDPVDRPQKFMDTFMKKQGMRAYGELSSDFIFSKMPDGHAAKTQMFRHLTNNLDDLVSTADKQTRDTRQIFGLPDALGVLLLNEKAKTYSDIIRWGLSKTFTKRSVDGPSNNAGVIFLHRASLRLSRRLSVYSPDDRFFYPDPARAEEFSNFSRILHERWSLI